MACKQTDYYINDYNVTDIVDSLLSPLDEILVFGAGFAFAFLIIFIYKNKKK